LIALFLLVFSLAVFFFLLLRLDPSVSTDFRLCYGPAAAELSDWVKGAGGFPEFPRTNIFYGLYVFFAGIMYAAFGAGNVTAVVSAQVILSAALMPYIYFLLLRHFTHRISAFLSVFFMIIFYDNIGWVTWTVPASLYRFLFVIFFTVSVDLYVRGRYLGFIAVYLPSFAILMITRPDTAFFYVPLHIAFVSLAFRLAAARKAVFLVFLAALLAVTVFLRDQAFNIFLKLSSVFFRTYLNGDVIVGLDESIPGVTTIGHFDFALADSNLYILKRFLKLILYRAAHFLNIFPVFWSAGHRVYYALHMIPVYCLAAAGITRIIRQKNTVFLMYFSVFVFSLFLHMFTRVDAALRTTYTSLIFLIMVAGFGLDYLLAGKPAFKSGMNRGS
jgi:hypothetical protein